MLLDSNLIIYSALPDHSFLKEFIRINQPYVSLSLYLYHAD